MKYFRKLLLLGKVAGLTVQLYLKIDSTKCRLGLFYECQVDVTSVLT